MEADLAVAVLEAEEALAEGLRCMMLPALNAEKTAKFHSDLQEKNLFYAVIALENAEMLVRWIIQDQEETILAQENLMQVLVLARVLQEYHRSSSSDWTQN